MKKVLIAAIALLGLSASSFAQATPTKKVDATKTTVTKKETKKTEPVKAVNPSTAKKATPPVADIKTVSTKKTTTETKTAAANKANNGAVVLKKDGTPDKRYSSSKTAAGPVKKDGTPDKRYKENKKTK
jgi:hypothetical protein